MAEFYVRRNQQVRGPLAADALRDLARQGKLRPEDELSRSQDGPWRPSSSIRGLQSIFGQQESTQSEEPSTSNDPEESSDADGTGMWVVSTTTDPTNDSSVYSFSVTSVSGVDRFGTPIQLNIRESNEGIELFISWGTDFFSSEGFQGEAQITSRAGSYAAGAATWSRSTDMSGTFLKNYVCDQVEGGAVLHAIRSLWDVDQAVFRCTPVHSNTITAVFDVRGLRQAMTPYRDTMRLFSLLPEVPDLDWTTGFGRYERLTFERTLVYQAKVFTRGITVLASVLVVSAIAGATMLTCIHVFGVAPTTFGDSFNDDQPARALMLLGALLSLLVVPMARFFRRKQASRTASLEEIQQELDNLAVPSS
tara:strand:+ start:202 stop:1293 length:1092 start_codon:yes stop_codon:yes gene_type:complete